MNLTPIGEAPPGMAGPTNPGRKIRAVAGTVARIRTRTKRNLWHLDAESVSIQLSMNRN